MKYKKLFFSIFLSCFISIFMLTEGKAAPPPVDVILTSQAEVNAFVGATVTGNLTIQESVPNNITDLSPLYTLTSVGGTLTIQGNTALTSLWGLNALNSVGGDLSIFNNPALTTQLRRPSSGDQTPIGRRQLCSDAWRGFHAA